MHIKFARPLLVWLLFSTANLAQATDINDLKPWTVSYFYGITASDALARIVVGNFHRWPEHVQAIELTRTLPIDNPIRQFFSPLVSVVQLSANVAQRSDHGHQIGEFNPYIAFRWVNFPWNPTLLTSFAIGEGISYDTSVPSLEKKANANTKRLLNYLMFEATFALPTHPEWQITARIHHRSGAYGLYRAGNTGSNVLGLGLKYLFS